jgi:exopolysaccharide biosynthesis operon protein EpsL
MAHARAEGDDTLTLNAAYALQTDSNLFRLPSSTRSSTPNATEKIGVTTFGLNLNKAYSLQRVELAVSLIDSEYQNNSYLSFVAHNYAAAWRWSASPELQGNLTRTYKESLNSFADNPTSNIRNQRTDTNTRLDAIYGLGGPWRVVGGFSSTVQNNVQPIAAEGNTSTTTAEAGLSYVWASGSALTYAFKENNGEYTNRALQPTALFDDSFRQHDHELKLRWLVSAKSTAEITATHINRTHPHYGQRNYSGINTRARIDWAISSKYKLTANWAHELASYQTGNTNYTSTDRLTLSPVWQISPKTTLRLSYEMAFRHYQGTPTSAAASQRSDTVRDASLSLDWQPYQSLILSTTLQNSKRTSNQANLDYDSNMATFSAQYSY